MTATAKVKIKRGSKTFGQFANLPSAFKSPPKGLADKEMVIARIDGLKRVVVKQLQEAANQLALINRYNIKNEKRITLVNAIMVSVYATMFKHYQKYQTNVLSLPESKERREVILACIDITEQAAIACKHYFKEIYSSKSLSYRRNRRKCIDMGVQILELLRIEQRFRALRHQKLPPAAWQDINRVFFSLLVHGDVDEPKELLGYIGTWAKKASIKKQNASASAKKLYLSIQLFGLLDAPGWSTRLFHSADAYLDNITDAITIHTDDKSELEPGWLITNIDHKGPPLFQRENHLVEPCIKFEYSNLYNRLILDYEELAKMKFIDQFDEDKLSQPLFDLEAIERFPLLETMLFGLRPRERKQKRHAAFGHESLKLFFGYRQTFNLLMDMATDEVKRLTKTRAFSDTLAGGAAGLSDDLKTRANTKWEIVNFSSGGILVLTRESANTNPIQIGQLVAFNPNDDVKRPMLGYVSRINRPSDQQVEVAIVRFSNHAESALLQDNQQTGSAGSGVIIFQNMEGKWCLISRHDYDFVSGIPFKLLRENNKTIPARLGNVMLSKQEFMVFELSAPGM